VLIFDFGIWIFSDSNSKIILSLTYFAHEKKLILIVICTINCRHYEKIMCNSAITNRFLILLLL
jgi:hypothetical protein